MEYNFDQFENDVQEKPINLREVYEKYIVYWKWILASVLIACVIGFFYLRTQPYTYHLTTTLLVVDQSKSGAMNEMSMMKQLDVMGFGSSLSMVNNEDEVLKSSALMKRVVNQLELHTTYTTKDFLRTIDLYTASPYYVKMDSMALMQLEKTLSFEIAREEGQYTIEGEYNDSAFSQTVKKLPAMINTPAGPISIALRKGLKFLPQKEITVTISNPNAVGRYISAKLLTTEVSKQVDVINRLSIFITLHRQLTHDLSQNIKKNEEIYIYHLLIFTAF